MTDLPDRRATPPRAALTLLRWRVARPALFDPPPYPDPERLVLVAERGLDGGGITLGYATFRDLERESRTIGAAAAMSYWQPTVSDGQETERLAGQRVTHRFFEVLGVRPLLGRFFDAAEDVPGANTVAVLGHGRGSSRVSSTACPRTTR